MCPIEYPGCVDAIVISEKMAQELCAIEGSYQEVWIPADDLIKVYEKSEKISKAIVHYGRLEFYEQDSV
jgi:hypothetical protein